LLLLLLVSAAGAEDALDAATKALLDDDPEVRVAAAGRLSRMGPAATPAVPALLDAIFDEDNQVARAAIDALGRIGPKDPEAVRLLRVAAATRPFLEPVVRRTLRLMGVGLGEGVRLPPATADLVDDPRPSVCMPATWALARDPAADATFLRMLGHGGVRRRRIAVQRPFGISALPGLLKALKDPDTRVRRGALSAIRYPPEALPDLVRILDEDDPALAADVSYALGAMGPAAVPALVRELASPHAECRQAACSALGSLGRHAAPAVPALIEACFDDETSSAAIGALRRLGTEAKEAAPYLAELADASSNELARLALQAMRGEPVPPPPSPPDNALLRRQLSDADARTAGHAAFELGRLLASDPETLDALGAALANPAPYVRKHAALALVRIGGVSVIARVATEGRGPARHLAAAALPKFVASAPDAVLPVALNLLGDGDPFVRGEALRAVGMLGPRAREATDRLIEYARGEDRALAASAAWALGCLRTEAAVTALLALLDRPRGDVQEDVQAAIFALGEIGAAAAVPALVAEAWRPDDTHFSDAVRALAMLGAAGQVQVVALVRAESGMNRNTAISVLTALNLHPHGFAEALQEATKDPDSSVRETALLAAFSQKPRPGIETLVAAALAEPRDRAPASRLHETMAQVATVAELLAVAREKEPHVRGIAWLALSLKRRGDFTNEDAAAALPLLLDALDDPQVTHAASASVSVVPLGAPDPRVLRYLLPEPGSRTFNTHAAERIGKAIHDMGPRIVPALTKALGERDPRIRAGAAAALEGFGVAARSAVPALRDALVANAKNALPFVRAIVAAADLETIAELFADPAMPAHEEFASALVAAGRDALPYVDRLRQDEDAAVRRAAVRLLPQLFDVPNDWILKAAADEDDEVANSALGQLGKAVPAETAIPVLARAARDGALRRTALRVLASRGVDALPTLAELVADESADVRALTLQELGAAGAPALGLIAEALKDKEPKVRAAAAVALRWLGGDAAPALPAVRELLADEDTQVRDAAAGTLGKLKDKASVPALVNLFSGGSASDRRSAGDALASIGAAEAIARFIAHFDPATRETAQVLLAAMGERAVPALAALLGPDDATTSHEAAAVLSRIGEPAVPALAGLLRREGAARDAAWALGGMGANAARAVPDLVAALEDKDPLVVSQAAWALGQIGPRAKDALPALEKMQAHRVIVADAIRRIRGDPR
jgi:HEAT repeat protein